MEIIKGDKQIKFCENGVIEISFENDKSLPDILELNIKDKSKIRYKLILLDESLQIDKFINNPFTVKRRRLSSESFSQIPSKSLCCGIESIRFECKKRKDNNKNMLIEFNCKNNTYWRCNRCTGILDKLMEMTKPNKIREQLEKILEILKSNKNKGSLCNGILDLYTCKQKLTNGKLNANVLNKSEFSEIWMCKFCLKLTHKIINVFERIIKNSNEDVKESIFKNSTKPALNRIENEFKNSKNIQNSEKSSDSESKSRRSKIFKSRHSKLFFK